MYNSYFQKFFSSILLFTIVLSSFNPASAFAQADEIKREVNTESGKISFIGPAKGDVLPAQQALNTSIRPQDPAMALAIQFAPEFGIQNPQQDLSELKSVTTDEGRITTRFQQTFQGIPVMAGELIVNTNENGDLYSINGEVSPKLSLQTEPTIDSAQAKSTALEAIAKWYELSPNDFVATQPELWIFDESLLQPSNRPIELVWRLEVSPVDNSMPVRELVLVNAQTGSISFLFNQIDTAWRSAGKTKNKDLTQQDTTPTPTATPQPGTDSTSEEGKIFLTPTPTNQQPDATDNTQETPSFLKAGVSWYVNIATGSNSNSCTSSASPCKDIQETINKATTGDTIYVTSGTYIFSSNGSPNVIINNGKNLTLSGGWDSTFTNQNNVSIIDGQNANNGYLHTGGTVAVESFIIQNSRSSNSGAIYLVNGNLTIRRTTLKNNIATSNGGGIFVDNGTVTIINSTISGNTANSNGGGIYASNNSGSSVIIQSSTIANNISANGGGINRTNGAVNITNSIIANNTATSSAPDCNGTITSVTYSIVENTTGCTITSSSNNLNVDPQISASLSGTFQVHTLQTGSPARNAGTNTDCPTTDQTGTSRPQGTICDMGAFELIGSGTDSINIASGNNQSASINTAFASPLSVLVLDENDTPVNGVSVTFTAPGSGASNTFAATSTNTTTVITGSDGIATTTTLTTNGTTGTYNVVASASGYTSANFQLNNVPYSDPNGRYVTTTGNDTSNNCQSPSTPCLTINRAISQAVSGNIIYVTIGTYSSTSGQYVVSINKPLTLSGGWNSSFSTQSGFSTVDGQNVRNGISSVGGGTNTIEYFIIQNGQSSLSGGGVMLNTPTVINNSIIKNNAGGDRGGGVYVTGGSLTLNNSTIENNSANIGAGIHLYTNASLTINNSTINGNFGDGIQLNGGSGGGPNPVINITNSTIVNNSGVGFLHQPYSPSRVVTITNSIIANNVKGDCTGAIGTANNNIIMNMAGCTIITGSNNVHNTNPLVSEYPVGALRYLTLKSGSPAINSGANCLSLDQRGMSRPQGVACDRGSFESVTSPGVAVIFDISTGNNQHTGLQKSFSLPLVVYVVDANNSPVSNVNVTFTAPSSGASGIFQGTNSNIVTVTTNESGLAISPVFTSNSQSGSYQVVATASGLSGSVNFQLTNMVWYVSTTGNDSNSCQTPLAACLTINGAITKSSHGETIRVTAEVFNLTQSVNVNKGIELSGGWNNTFTTQTGFTTLQSGGALTAISINSPSYAGSLSRFIFRDNDIGITQTSGIFNYTQFSSINNDNGLRIQNGIANIVNATIAGNDGTSLAGSAISNGLGVVNINYSTITNNSGGSSIYTGNANGHVYLTNTIFTNNPSSCSPSTISSNGYNILYLNGCSGFTTHATDQLNVDPKLGFQLPAGAYTLLPTSPAKNAGGGGCPTIDQMGNSRPQGSGCDIGAFEFTQGGITPTYIVIYQGSPQSFDISTPAPINLGVLVIDSQGKTIENETVTFTAPSTGASGKFANNTTSTTAQTNADGIAIASVFTANSLMGSYVVQATVSGIGSPAEFSITNNIQDIETYTANNSTSLPGTFLCNESSINCSNGSDLHADKTHQYTIGTYQFYVNNHNRQSLDDNNLPLISTVHYGSGYQNAFWSGTQMVYGDGYGFALADDVVAHELTHGVTQYESNLFYYYQSGAINESFSDLWGEYYDQTNGQGNDNVNVKWLIGENISGLGAIRNMSDPTANGDPDKMTSSNYYLQSGDNGGVHYNSGVNNKAIYLMVDGGTFNNKTVTPLGWDKTAKIYYEVQTNLLSSGADYSDLYYALQQACTNLVGQHAITSGDCAEVKDAIDAVEMNLQPIVAFNTDAPMCTYNSPVIRYSDDIETGTSQWTFTNSSAYTRWQLDSSFGQYAQSGQHSLYADDYPGSVTDASARWTSFVVPNNAYLHFAHAYGFEYGGGANYYDGGVLEYSTNNGSTWVDAGYLMDYNGYDSTILNYVGNNPLEGRLGFVGDSHGYISTRVNLASFAGQTILFRWRMGLDESVANAGWWVDNIRVYTCGAESTFADVPLNASAWAHIESIYDAGITGGCTTTPLNYCPNNTVSRAQMAIFLMRGIHGSSYSPPPATGTVFSDVPSNAFGAAFIEAFANEGITGGCGAGNYCPNNTVTRAQMAIFLLRAKYGSTYNPPAATGTMFNDVPLGTLAPWIEQLANEGITGGCGGGNYCPNSSVTRAQMAIFMQRTFNLPLP